MSQFPWSVLSEFPLPRQVSTTWIGAFPPSWRSRAPTIYRSRLSMECGCLSRWAPACGWPALRAGCGADRAVVGAVSTGVALLGVG